MLSVAITGAFRSGKTALSAALSSKGFEVFSADSFVSALYREKSFQKKISDILSIKAFDKASVAEIIYENENLKKNLENFLHPIVLGGYKYFSHIYGDREFIFAEIPLLFEAGFDRYFDYKVATKAPAEVRIARALSAGVGEGLFFKIERAQMPEGKKNSLADYIIDFKDPASAGIYAERLLTHLREICLGK